MSEHDITDLCPECDRPYSFPLDSVPETIGAFRIEAPIGRGFYAATYLARYGMLGARAVLKVTPQKTYRYFNKNFTEESQLHLEVSQGTQHLASIVNAFDSDVAFGDIEIPCHVGHLEYVEGLTLAEFLAEPDNCTARNLAQITVDLFSLMQELSIRQKYHNDLHAKNIIVQALERTTLRSGEAIVPSIRAVAIDLGSLAEMSKSVPLNERLGDLLQVARHILTFRNHLLERPNETGDMEYRLAIQLDQIGHILAPDPLSQREPPYTELIRRIQDGYGRSSSPWKAPSELASFSESYNAQTLHPSFVRRLLVDPDDEWLPMVSGKGPQVITGIRGCGKTMLLKALQSHSQISHHVEKSADLDEAISNIRKEGYLGLYVPTNRLLDPLGSSRKPVSEPYARLFVAYALEALGAARHLSEVKPGLLSPGYWHHIARAVASYVKGSSGLEDAPTDTALEAKLFSILVSLDKGEGLYTLGANPAVAFPHLAEAIQQTSYVWTDTTVLYLLDDVSTRNLSQEDIGRLLGTLLFANPYCAFKMTTEVQTMELLLKSPGLIETARVGRDYDTFDLSARVADRLTNRRGVEFVERILENRSSYYPKHPPHTPRQLLGEETLEQIARDIATTGASAPQKKTVYRGLRALTALCVGDIGDILKIYEAIIRHYEEPSLPIPFDKQSAEFQEYCSKQLYHLHRRKGELKDFALSFAQAAHRLLVRSATAAETENRRELRQYTQLYVRVTTGDMDWQFEKLRELIDAGVFVLKGGSDVPRTKTRDSNPTHQFILTYRKLYGLSSFIGLSNRDRFELSGEDLIAWLNNPASGADILGRNLGLGENTDLSSLGSNGDQELVAKNAASPSTNPAVSSKTYSHQLPMAIPVPASLPNNQNQDHHQSGTGYSNTASRLPVVSEISNIEEEAGSIATIVTSLGFEDRALISSTRLFPKVCPENIILVRYPVTGHSEKIRALAQDTGISVLELDHSELIEDFPRLPEGEVMVDVTGLAKPAIFKAIVQALSQNRTVVVAHTQAEAYYPLDEHIEPILAFKESGDTFTVLERAQEIWTGEKGPHQFIRLLRSDVDQSRRRLLCAAVSPQHERLLSLVDQRDYDGLCIILPTGSTPRAKLASLAAEVATQGRYGHRVDEMDSDDLKGMVRLLGIQFDDFYTREWFDIEFGLTGSKMHAVACAAASVVLKIAQCWYVQPESFDPNRFTVGARETRLFRISLPSSLPGSG